MPRVVVIAGPNGAGKTSFASRYTLEDPALAYVNADEIAREPALATLSQTRRDIAAGRTMLKRLDALVSSQANFMYETTLATRTYVQHWRRWRTAGYHLELVYLKLPDADTSVARVARRVAAGGHGIPEATIRRRFELSLTYLEDLYKPLCDTYSVWNSIEGDFEPIERWP
jgi:predicted ABC-type ATPase